MPAPQLKIDSRTAYFRKAIKTPGFATESVLTRDPFTFAELWLLRECKAALSYWRQARHYYEASQTMPPESAPLTIYYCMLNAVKALLAVKGVPSSAYHGVSGAIDDVSRRVLSNEIITFRTNGVMGALSRYLEEEDPRTEHTLTDLLGNLAYIHRAFRHTFASKPDLFIPIEKPGYRKHPTPKENRIWWAAEVSKRFDDKRILKTLPAGFEKDLGYSDVCVIRSKKRVKWASYGGLAAEKQRALERLWGQHRRIRLDVKYISGSKDLWYLKRKLSGSASIRRHDMTIAMAAMHRLSELSRYDPKGLIKYLESKENWLLTEFIQLAPNQFIDELVCEMTSLEIRIPGVRPGVRP